MATAFFSVPLMARYLNAEAYGFFLTVSALAAWLGFADLGFGNGLTNRIAESRATSDTQAEGEYFASALWMVGGISLFLGGLLALSLVFVPWRAVFALSEAVSDSEIRWTVAAVFGLWLASMAPGLTEKVYAGYQRIFVNNVWTTIAGLAALCGLAIAVYTRAPLPVIVLVVSGPTLAVRLVSTVVLVLRRRWLFPRPSLVRRSRLRSLGRLGGGFFVAQLAAIGIWQTDQLVLTHLVGPTAVPAYVLTLRLTTLYVGVLMTWLSPIGPACTDAAARGDYEWVRRSYHRMLRRSLALTAVVVLGLVLLGRWAISLWAGESVVPRFALVCAMGLYLLIYVWCQTHAIVLNALGRVARQAMYGVLAAVINLVASLVLGSAMGEVGVCLATSLGALPAAVLLFIETREVLKAEAVEA